MIRATVLCSACGAALDASARFCVACGKPVASTSPERLAAGDVPRGIKGRMLEQLRDATLGEYEILLELGSGGMATVYLAHDLQLDRKVAIKLMHPALVAGEDMVERFILEARTAAGLSHANIVPIYAVKVQEELLYFVMKFIEGRPLDSIIKAEAPLAPDTVRQVVTQVADALGYAHRHGVVHRDIKPANIIISTDGHPVLADFGIAKVADRPGLTLTGATIGTPTYMSPEQCGAEPVTGATDQYSLGVTAFEMLTGAPPFDAPSHMTLMLKQMSEPAPLVQGRAPGCPADLAAVIDRMLAKEPSDRFATMENIIEALQAGTVTATHKVRTQLVSYALADPRREQLKRVSTPRSPIPTAARRSRLEGTGPRRSIRPVVIGAALVLLLGAATMLYLQRDTDRPPSPPVTAVVPSPAPGAPAEQPPPATPRNEEPVAAAATPAPSPPPSAVRSAPARRDPAAATPDRTAAPVASTVPADGPDTFRAGGGVTSADSVIAVSIDPASLALASGESAGLAARVTGAGGNSLDRAVQWSSNSPLVATVGPTGKVTAVSPGVAIVTASTNGRTGAAAVSVTSPAVAPPPPAAADAPLTDGERRAQVTAMIQAYARAIESRDMARVRQFYPTMPSAREQQLQQALATMDKLQVQLIVGQIQADGDAVSAHVTGIWSFTSQGQRNSLPANDQYQVQRRGSGWVITEIK